MKNALLFLALLLAGSAPLLAQPLQTLYYENGKKYIEGRWTFTKRDLVPCRIGIEHDQYGNRTGGLYTISGPPDADTAMLQSYSWSNLRGPEDYLCITPDGMLTLWPADGTDYVELTYKNGVPNGPYNEYYAPGKPLQKGTLLNGMPNGPWTYYYKNGKPFYTGVYKAFTQDQLAQMWVGNYSGLKGGRPKVMFERRGDLSKADAMSQYLGAPLYLIRNLIGGGLKNGLFNFWYKDGAPWAEVAFEEDFPVGTWKIWESGNKTPKVILEWAGNGDLLFVTDSSGRRTNLKTRLEERAAETEARMASYSKIPVRVPAASQKKEVRGDVNGIDPGMVKPPVTGTPKNRSAPDTPLVYYYVQQMPQFDGDVHEWLTKSARSLPIADKEDAAKQVIVKFIVQPNGTLTNIELHKGIRSDLDAEALRLVKAMPKWNAGKQNGELVPVHYKLAVRFALP